MWWHYVDFSLLNCFIITAGFHGDRSNLKCIERKLFGQTRVSEFLSRRSTPGPPARTGLCFMAECLIDTVSLRGSMGAAPGFFTPRQCLICTAFASQALVLSLVFLIWLQGHLHQGGARGEPQ